MQLQCAQQQMTEDGNRLFAVPAQDTKNAQLQITAPVVGAPSIASDGIPLDQRYQARKRPIASCLVGPKSPPVPQPGRTHIITTLVVCGEARERFFDGGPDGIGVLGGEGR